MSAEEVTTVLEETAAIVFSTPASRYKTSADACLWMSVYTQAACALYKAI